ncbi:hypothetical protein CWE22_06095 [Pseudidiomarina aestuarii]|uniref:DUF3718 domain-containing protein n=1 Tax=Pseudidiomarina aestuarii TaxID=624146 RepID=A0A7Z6ZUU0_9GAMM|nr:DUF3718 domain-containing protein [Pseudidiomarina aestuarii]RUO41726.1 hypothetical protein CWE22_06095 [Pseudidiomarina aestuarii]
MMKWLIRITLSIIIGSSGYHIPSQAQQLGVQNVSADTALAICSFIRTNDTRALKQKLQYERKRLRDIYTSVRCNNLSLIQFALRHNAHDVGRFLAISANPDSVMQAGDMEWAKLNNLLDTPTGNVLRERMTCVRKSRVNGAEESCSQLFRNNDSRTENTLSFRR